MAFKVLCFALALVAVSGSVIPLEKVEVHSKTREVNIYEAIALMVEAHRVQKETDPQPRQVVCYEDENLGCFDTESGPMSEVGRLPTPPSELDTYFVLFNAANPGGITATQDDFRDVFTASNFDPSKQTVFTTHGFTNGIEDNEHWLFDIKETALKQDPTANVFVMHWGKGAQNNLFQYPQAATNTLICGRQLGLLASHLVSLGSPSSFFHGIGHSLGSHLMGFASNWLQEQNGVKFGKITAMDPAAPFFYDFGQAEISRLDKSDADRVVVLHTNSGALITGHLSSMEPIGHADFYPNGGQRQPGCPNLIIGSIEEIFGDADASCSHTRAHQFTATSIQDSGCTFQAFECPNAIEDFERDFVRGDCKISTPNQGEMGINGEGSGLLYLLTFDMEEVDEFCGQHFRLSVQSSSDVDRTYGSVVVTIKDGSTATKAFSIMDEDESVRGGDWDQRIVLGYFPAPAVTSVTIDYQRWDGVFNNGQFEWNLDQLQIEDGLSTYYVCLNGQTFKDREPQDFPVSTTPC